VKPLTVYAFNRARLPSASPRHRVPQRRRRPYVARHVFEDPRFERLQRGPNSSRRRPASASKRSTPFGVAICNADPNAYCSSAAMPGHTRWAAQSGSTVIRFRRRSGGGSGAMGLQRACGHHDLALLTSIRSNPTGITSYTTSAGPLAGQCQTWIWWTRTPGLPGANTCYEVVFDPDVPGRLWGAFSTCTISQRNIIRSDMATTVLAALCSARFRCQLSMKPGFAPSSNIRSVGLQQSARKRTLYAGVFMAVSTNRAMTAHWTAKNSGSDPSNMRVYRFLRHEVDLVCHRSAHSELRRQAADERSVGIYRSTTSGNLSCINASQPFLYPRTLVHPRDSQVLLVARATRVGRQLRWSVSDGTEVNTGNASVAKGARRLEDTFIASRRLDLHDAHEGAPGAGLWLIATEVRTWEAFATCPFPTSSGSKFDRSRDDLIYVTTFGAASGAAPRHPGR